MVANVVIVRARSKIPIDCSMAAQSVVVVTLVRHGSLEYASALFDSSLTGEVDVMHSYEIEKTSVHLPFLFRYIL